MIKMMEKQIAFFPRDKLFWIVNILAWVLTLDRLNLSGNSMQGLLEEGRSLLFWTCLTGLWVAYAAVGILAVLVFRHFCYRQQWGERRLAALFPLALLIALAAGMLLSFVIQLPVDKVIGTPFTIFREGGALFISGAFSVALYRGLSITVLLLLWLLAYWGISAVVNARNLAFRSLALESNLKGARLNALSGQINSHFLFNALNNIRFMIARDANRAEESLVALSEILRHSLDTSRNTKVPLSEELDITGKYLGLMKNQMGNRLEYTLQGSKDAGNYLIPPMMIQMLAENAIKHGVDRVREGGRVDIQCATRDGKLLVEVRNTAPTSNVASVADGELAVASTDGDNAQGKGLGLPNISNRLALLYGERARLTMSHQSNEFQVAIDIPGEAAQ